MPKGIRPDIEGYKEFVEAHDETAIAYAFKKYIKGCVEEELADVVIRCLSFAGLHGWDLQHALDEMKGTSDMDVIIGDEAFVETAFYTCDEFFGCFGKRSRGRPARKRGRVLQLQGYRPLVARRAEDAVQRIEAVQARREGVLKISPTECPIQSHCFPDSVPLICPFSGTDFLVVSKP